MAFEQPRRAGFAGLVSGLWQHRAVTAILIMAGVAGGLVLAGQATPQYGASARLFLSRTQPFEPFQQQVQQVDPERYLQTQVGLLTSDRVLLAASRALPGHPALTELRSQVSAAAAADADLLTVTAKGPTADAAAAEANAVVGAYRAQQAADTKALVAKAADSAGGAAAAQIEAQGRIASDGVAATEPATAASATTSSSRITYGLIGGLVGLLLAMVYARFRKPRTRSQPFDVRVARQLGGPLLAEVGRSRSAGPQLTVDGQHQRTYRHAIVALEYSMHRSLFGVLLVAGAAEAVGTTTVAINLAAAVRSDDRTAVLVDAGSGQRRLTQLSGVSAKAGLARLAYDRLDLTEVAAPWIPAPGIDLLVVPSREGDAAGLAGPGPSSETAKALGRLTAERGLVIIDGPPLVTDQGLALLGKADGVVLVITPRTSDVELQRARAILDFADTRLVGFVINDAPSPSGSGVAGAHPGHRGAFQQTPAGLPG